MCEFFGSKCKLCTDLSVKFIDKSVNLQIKVLNFRDFSVNFTDESVKLSINVYILYIKV